MTSLAESLAELEAVLDVLDDARAHDQTARSLTEVSGNVSRHREALEELAPLYSDKALPGRAGNEIDRWAVTLSKLDELVGRVRTAPETIRDGRLWTDTDATLTSLKRDIARDVRDRWDRMGQACEDLLDTGFLGGLPPGTPDARRYRDVADELAVVLRRQLPAVGNPAHAARLIDELRELREQLRAHEPPEELRADLELLLECRLPPERLHGALKAYLERTGLMAHLRLGLLPVDD